MAKNSRNPLPPRAEDDGISPDLTPRSVTKAEFGRRLHRMIVERGWTQSELARRAGVGRDLVSTYVRGRSFPEPTSLHKLSKALGVSEEQVLPNAAIDGIDRDPTPAIQIQQSSGHPDKVWVQVNQLVSSDQALRIMQILYEQPGAKDDGGEAEH